MSRVALLVENVRKVLSRDGWNIAGIQIVRCRWHWVPVSFGAFPPDGPNVGCIYRWRVLVGIVELRRWGRLSPVGPGSGRTGARRAAPEQKENDVQASE